MKGGVIHGTVKPQVLCILLHRLIDNVNQCKLVVHEHFVQDVNPVIMRNLASANAAIANARSCCHNRHDLSRLLNQS